MPAEPGPGAVSGGALLGLFTALLGGNLAALAASNLSHAMAQTQRSLIANLHEARAASILVVEAMVLA